MIYLLHFIYQTALSDLHYFVSCMYFQSPCFIHEDALYLNDHICKMETKILEMNLVSFRSELVLKRFRQIKHISSS